jgi:hypothetical protein
MVEVKSEDGIEYMKFSHSDGFVSHWIAMQSNKDKPSLAKIGTEVESS